MVINSGGKGSFKDQVRRDRGLNCSRPGKTALSNGVFLSSGGLLQVAARSLQLPIHRSTFPGVKWRRLCLVGFRGRGEGGTTSQRTVRRVTVCTDRYSVYSVLEAKPGSRSIHSGLLMNGCPSEGYSLRVLLRGAMDGTP